MAASLKELTDKANALKAAGRMADAIAAHRQIVALAPGNGVVLHNLAAALGDAGQNREAVDIAKRALATGLNAPETWLVLGRSLVAVDLMAEAEDAFRKVLSHCGSFTDIRGGHNYPPMIRKADKKPIRVFLQDGENDLDNQFGNWPLANRQMAKALAFKEYDYTFVMGTEGHNGKHGGAILPDSLRWLWRGYPGVKAAE